MDTFLLPGFGFHVLTGTCPLSLGSSVPPLPCRGPAPGLALATTSNSGQAGQDFLREPPMGLSTRQHHGTWQGRQLCGPAVPALVPPPWSRWLQGLPTRDALPAAESLTLRESHAKQRQAGLPASPQLVSAAGGPVSHELEIPSQLWQKMNPGRAPPDSVRKLKFFLSEEYFLRPFPYLCE